MANHSKSYLQIHFWLLGVLWLTAIGCGSSGSKSHPARLYDFYFAGLQHLPVASPETRISRTVFVFKREKAHLPPVLLLNELPGLTMETLEYADTLSQDFTVYVPLLFGAVKQHSLFRGLLAYAFNGEWRQRDNGRPIVSWLRDVVREIAAAHPGQKIGIIGMCLTGAFPLALVDHPAVHGVVIAQPTLPFVGDGASLGLLEEEEATAVRRVQTGQLRVYGVRFEKGRIADRRKHERMRDTLFRGHFIDDEICASAYTFRGPAGRAIYRIPDNAHSTLTLHWKPGLPDHPSQVRRKAVRAFLMDPHGFESRWSPSPCGDRGG